MATNSESGSSGEIDVAFVENILKEKVLRICVDAGSNPGDNFMSRMYSIGAVLAKDPESIVHFVVKAYPALAARQGILNRSNIFLKEIQVYKEFVPALIDFQNGSPHIINPAVPPFLDGKAIDFMADNYAKTCGTVQPLDNYLAMLDIRKSWGYRMALKTEGLDYAHAKLVITELARFHALGWAYKEKNNLSCLSLKFPFLRDTMMTERGTDMEEMFRKNFKMVQNIAAKYFSPGSRALQGIQRLIDLNPMDIMESFLPPDGVPDEKALAGYIQDGGVARTKIAEPWTTACHGDCWVNNMLFRYNDDKNPTKPTDLIFVDLQLARIGCPTTDLAYLLYSSTTRETRTKHLSSFLQLYYDTFLDTCNTLSVEPFRNFSLETLTNKFRRAQIYGFVVAVLILPIILCQNVPDMDNGIEGAKDMSDLFDFLAKDGENKNMEGRLIEIFNEFVEENVF